MIDARASIERLVLALRSRGEGQAWDTLFAPDVRIERFAPPRTADSPPPAAPSQIIEGREAALAWVRLTPAKVDFALDGDMLPHESVPDRFVVRYRYWMTSEDWQNGGWWHFETSEEGISWLAHRPDARPPER